MRPVEIIVGDQDENVKEGNNEDRRVKIPIKLAEEY